jgi:hypothetical protein
MSEPKQTIHRYQTLEAGSSQWPIAQLLSEDVRLAEMSHKQKADIIHPLEDWIAQQRLGTATIGSCQQAPMKLE